MLVASLEIFLSLLLRVFHFAITSALGSLLGQYQKGIVGCVDDDGFSFLKQLRYNCQL